MQLQAPVRALCRRPRRVGGSGHVRTGQTGQLLDEGRARRPGADVAAIEQDVGVRGQVRADLRPRGTGGCKPRRIDRLAADYQRAGPAVRDDRQARHRRAVTHRREHLVGDRLLRVEPLHLDSGTRRVGERAGVGDRGVDQQHFAPLGRRRIAGGVDGGSGGRRLGVVRIVMVGVFVSASVMNPAPSNSSRGSRAWARRRGRQ